MKAQVSILVKNASLFSRLLSMGVMWKFSDIFAKMPVYVWIDQNPETE